MNIDNPLTRDFLLNHPVEAARTLEQVSAEHVAALFTELPSQQVVLVLSAMLPAVAAACLEKTPHVIAARLLTQLPVSSAARLYRLLVHAKQDEISAHFSDETFSRIRHNMVYPDKSAAALRDSRIDVLPQNINVAEAIHRIGRLDHAINCEVYIIDESHHLVGLIKLGKLLASDHQTSLRDIMQRKTQPVSAHTPAETLLSHPGWAIHRRLPVVERDGTLIGALEFSRVRDSVSEVEVARSRDPLENMLSLASLYWLSMAQLMDGVLSITRSDKGDRP